MQHPSLESTLSITTTYEAIRRSAVWSILQKHPRPSVYDPGKPRTSPQQRRHSLLAQCMRPTLNVRPKVWRHRTTSPTPNHLVYIEPRVAIVSQRSGHHLNRHIPLDDSQLEDCLALFSHLVHRPFKPLKRIIIESINNEPATESRHPKTFKTVFNAHDESAEFVLYRS